MAIRFPHPWGATDHQERRPFGIGPRHGIEQFQGPHAIGHHRHAEALEAGMGIGGKASPLFAGCADHLNRRLLEAVKQAQHVIPRDAIDPANAALHQGFDQGVGDVHAGSNSGHWMVKSAYGPP